MILVCTATLRGSWVFELKSSIQETCYLLIFPSSNKAEPCIPYSTYTLTFASISANNLNFCSTHHSATITLWSGRVSVLLYLLCSLLHQLLPVISSLSGSRVNIIRHQTWLYQKALCSGKDREKSGSDLGALLSWHSVTDVVKISRTHKGLQDKFAQEYFVSLSHTLLY